MLIVLKQGASNAQISAFLDLLRIEYGLKFKLNEKNNRKSVMILGRYLKNFDKN